MAEKHCYALLLAYDGGAFVGFQRQPPMATIQGALEDALATLGLKSRIEGGGRTDKGVHARRQVVTIRPRLNIPLDTSTLPSRLNPLLPAGLQVLEAMPAPMSFHARFSAINKVYRYRVAAASDPTPWEEHYAWVLPDSRGFPDLEGPVEALDEAAMREVLTALTGWHDFRHLAHLGAEGKPRRLLARAELVVHPRHTGGSLYEFTFTGPGFIRHQIRNMMGLIVTAGLGLLQPGMVEPLLNAEGDRWRGARAPGRGLTLWDIQYQRGQDPFRPEGLGQASPLDGEQMPPDLGSADASPDDGSDSA